MLLPSMIRSAGSESPASSRQVAKRSMLLAGSAVGGPVREGVGEVEEEGALLRRLDEEDRLLGVAPGQDGLVVHVRQQLLLSLVERKGVHVVAVRDAEVEVEAVPQR